LRRSPSRRNPTGKAASVGYLSVGSTCDPRRIALTDAFRLGLGDLGYARAGASASKRDFLGTTNDRLPDLAAELVRLKVDVLVAYSTPATKAARDATKTIPIVMTAVVDPVATGLWPPSDVQVEMSLDCP
jgi:putative ABC transport system substrate-binding protein